MKILHIEAGKNLYGGALQVQYLLRALAERNIENVLACPEGSAIAQSGKEYSQVVAMPMGGDADIAMPFRLVRCINKYQPDIVHCHSRRGADHWGVIAANLSHRPVIITRRVDNTEWPPFARWKARKAKKVVAISNGIACVQERLGVSEEKLMTIRSAVDTELFQPHSPLERSEFLNRFSLEGNAQIIAIIAQLIPRKGHRLLFNAIHALKDNYPQIQLLVFGKGAEEEALRALAHALGIHGHIKFVGFHNDIHKLLPHVDIVAHPASKEGLGVALLQASACAKPIVAGRAGGIPEVVIDGETGYLIDPEDTEALASKLESLLENKTLRESMGKQARQHILENFSIDRMADDYVELYKQLRAC